MFAKGNEDLNNVRRGTLADQVAKAIVNMIYDQDLKPGSSIGSEAALARRFGVNRLVIREAIRTLTARGILISGQGKPAQVSQPSGAILAQILDFYMRQHAVDYRDLVLTRRLIEGELAARAAMRIKGGEDLDFEGAESSLRAMQRSQNEIDLFVREDLKFHENIATMSGNELLRLILSSLEQLLLEGRKASFQGRLAQGKGHESTLEAHKRVLEAIRAGDEQEARQAMYDHLDDTWQDLEVERSGDKSEQSRVRNVVT